MIKFINRLTGTVMRVDDANAEKYLAAGHRPVVPAPPKPEAAPPKTARKRTKK